MNPMVILTAVFATAAAAPSNYAAGPVAAIGALPVAHAGYAVAAAPVAAVSVPAPYTTQQVQGAPAVSVHQPPAQVTKQLHYADQTYVAGYATEILKPAIPDFNIAVPTALKSTQQINPAIVKVAKETHVVNEPFPVDRPYNVPYDVVKHVEKIIEVPTPVHVSKPYAVEHPVPVRGEDIVQVHRTAPIVKHTHHAAIAHPVAATYAGAYAAAPVRAYPGAYAGAYATGHTY